MLDSVSDFLIDREIFCLSFINVEVASNTTGVTWSLYSKVTSLSEFSLIANPLGALTSLTIYLPKGSFCVVAVPFLPVVIVSITSFCAYITSP